MTEPLSIQQAIAAVKKSIGAVGKSEKNQQQGWNFRGIDAVLNAVSIPLAEHGVTVYPQLLDYTYETVEVGRNKTAMAHVVVKVKYIFLGPKGDHIETAVAAEAMDSGDKAMTKAFSVALRTCLIQTLSLPTDEPDPDQDIYERSGNAQEAAPKASRQSAGSTTKVPSTAPAPAAEATADDITSFIKMIQAAKTTDQLNKAWTAIGAKGALQTTVVFEGSEVTLERALFKKADDIKAHKSS